MSKSAASKASTFAGLDEILGKGFDTTLVDDEYDLVVDLSDIHMPKQIARTALEDADNDLVSLGKSLRKRQLQPIILRPLEGHEKPYELVAGERRVRGALLEGLPTLRARVFKLTDEEAREVQLRENIDRLNLTQIEEARGLQFELDQLNGDIDALLAQYNRSRAWLSKRLSLLNLEGEAARLVTERASADLEVINSVRQIQKVDPDAAKEVVDKLKESRGTSKARDIVKAAQRQVKQKKDGKAPNKGQQATARDRSGEAPGDVVTSGGTPLEPTTILADAYAAICEKGNSPKGTLDKIKGQARQDVEDWLHSFYDVGVATKDVGKAVMQGFRNGQFAQTGSGAFALSSFLYGVQQDVKFSVLNVFGSVKE